jgi:hypothetical protein
MKTDLFGLIAHPCLFVAALLAAAGASANPVAATMEGFTCTGKLQIPNDQEEHTIEFSFDAPDRHGAQGTYLIDGRGKASNFYGCRQSGDSLSCTYDAGPASGPLTMRVSGDLTQIKGEFNSPFENSAAMPFTARCKKTEQ